MNRVTHVPIFARYLSRSNWCAGTCVCVYVAVFTYGLIKCTYMCVIFFYVFHFYLTPLPPPPPRRVLAHVFTNTTGRNPETRAYGMTAEVLKLRFNVVYTKRDRRKIRTYSHDDALGNCCVRE